MYAQVTIYITTKDCFFTSLNIIINHVYQVLCFGKDLYLIPWFQYQSQNPIFFSIKKNGVVQISSDLAGNISVMSPLSAGGAVDRKLPFLSSIENFWHGSRQKLNNKSNAFRSSTFVNLEDKRSPQNRPPWRVYRITSLICWRR